MTVKEFERTLGERWRVKVKVVQSNGMMEVWGWLKRKKTGRMEETIKEKKSEISAGADLQRKVDQTYQELKEAYNRNQQAKDKVENVKAPWKNG